MGQIKGIDDNSAYIGERNKSKLIERELFLELCKCGLPRKNDKNRLTNIERMFYYSGCFDVSRSEEYGADDMCKFRRGVDERATEIDLRPELCRYQDEGCELADACLDCPFPRCIYERPHGRQKLMKKARDREIKRLFISKKKSVMELSQIFGVTERTIQRVVKDVRQ